VEAGRGHFVVGVHDAWHDAEALALAIQKGFTYAGSK
jgi:xanthine/CO dehydrogenase XdhC/CoxF family maturation factor